MPDPPEPPPPPNQSSDRDPVWHGAGGQIVAALVALLGVIGGIVVGNTGVAREQLPGSPVETVTRTVSTTKTITKTVGSNPASPNITKGGYYVRRTTTSTPITLRYGYSVDLDSKIPDWEIGYAHVADRFDLGFNEVSLDGEGNGDVAVVTGPKRAETCAFATAYGGVDTDKLRRGLKLCVRTSDRRLAYFTVTAFDIDARDSVTLTGTVWDPPAPSPG